MQYLAVLIMALPAAGVADTRTAPTPLALMDVHNPALLGAGIVEMPAQPVLETLTPDVLLPSSLKVTATPNNNSPYRVMLRLGWYQYFVDQYQPDQQSPALAHDAEFQVGSGGSNHGGYRSPFTGLWDLSSQLHADIHIGHLIFAQDETTLRLISIATTSTRTSSWQPGFVVGIGTTW